MNEWMNELNVYSSLVHILLYITVYNDKHFFCTKKVLFSQEYQENY